MSYPVGSDRSMSLCRLPYQLLENKVDVATDISAFREGTDCRNNIKVKSGEADMCLFKIVYRVADGKECSVASEEG